MSFRRELLEGPVQEFGKALVLADLRGMVSSYVRGPRGRKRGATINAVEGQIDRARHTAASAKEIDEAIHKALTDLLSPIPERAEEVNVAEAVNDNAVVVECKQGAPTLQNIEQLRGYVKHVRKLTRKKTRGILVHGGAASLSKEVRKKLSRDRTLKIVRYSLNVDFVPST